LLRAYLPGSLYMGQVYAGVAVGLAARLATGFIAGSTVSAIGVIDLTRAL